MFLLLSALPPTTNRAQARQWRAARWPLQRPRGSLCRCGRASDANQSSTTGFFVAEVRDCGSCPFGRRLAPPCSVHDDVAERAVEDGAGKSGARLRQDAALEAAEDGHVAGLQVRRAALSQRRIHACPSLPGFITSSNVAVSCRSVVLVAQPFSDVTW